MQASDRGAFRKLLTGIWLTYGKTLHELVLNIWWGVFENREFQHIKNALEAHVVHPDKGQYLPKPADVVELLEGSHESQALQAWALVAKSIRCIGSYESVVFPDTLIHAVIDDMGGWVALCKTGEEELPFRARVFEKRYQSLLTHPPLSCPHQLTGIWEQQNRLSGYLPPDPVVIAPIFSSTKPVLEVV